MVFLGCGLAFPGELLTHHLHPSAPTGVEGAAAGTITGKRGTV